MFLDADGEEITINPFEDGVWTGGEDFPQSPDDVGTILDAKLVAIESELGGGDHLKWTPASGATGTGFGEVAVIVDIRDEEVDIMLPNVLASYDADISS